MNHLTTYKLFESADNLNEYYSDLVYLLQDVFDEFNIVAKSNENAESEDNDHLFWAIWIWEQGKMNKYTSDLSDVGNDTISCIIVYNVYESISKSFRDKLHFVMGRFNKQTGMSVNYKSEEINDGVWDCIIKITK